MTQKALIFVLLALLVAGGIYFFSKDQADKPDSSQDVYTDSIPAPEQPTIEASKDTTPTPPPVGEDLAPGTALIRATILAVDYKDDLASRISVRIDEVMGYGSATPPLATNTELSLDIFDYLKGNPSIGDAIQENGEITVVVASQQQMQIQGSEKEQSWQLVEFKQ